MAESSDIWKAGWDDSRRAQLDAIARATPAQRLEWLEEALQLALASGALEREREKGS